MSDTGFKSPGKHISSRGQSSQPNVRSTNTTSAGANQGALDAKRAAQQPPMPSGSSSSRPGSFSADEKATSASQVPQTTNSEPKSALESHASNQADQAAANKQNAAAPNAPEKPANPNLGNPDFKPGTTRSADEMNALTGAKPRPDTDLGHPGKQSADRGATPAGFDPNKKGALSASEQDKAKQAYVDSHKREGDQKYAKAQADFFHKHKKKLLGGGGIAGVILVMVMGFFSLLPLKLESIMKNITNHEMGRAESYVDRRVQAILFRYLYERVTGTLASDGFYTGNSIIRTLYGNLRINKFEDKLLKEKGIKIEKTGARSVRLTLADGSKFDAASQADLVKHLDTDLKGKQAKLAFKAVVDSTYHPLQFLKRRHLRKDLINAFNIRKFSIPKKDDKKDPKDPKLPSTTEADLADNVVDPVVDKAADAVDCVLGDNCPDRDRHNPDGSNKHKPPVADPERTGDAAAGEAIGATEAKKGIRAAYKSMKAATTATIKASLEAVFGEVITKTIFKAVPVVGWLSLAADIDNFFWEGKISKIAIGLHEAQYAASASTWASLADQFKAGELAGSQVNVLMTMLGDVEKSRAVQCILFKNCTAGTPLPKDKRVGSDSAAPLDDGANDLCGLNWFVDHVNDPPPSSEASSADFWTWSYRMGFNIPPAFTHSTLCAIRIPLNWINDAIGWLISAPLGAITDGAIKLLNAAASAITHHPVDVLDIASKGLSKLVNFIWSPVVTGREVGAALGNVIDAGWDVIGNQFCQDILGCQNITYKHAFNENLALASEHQAELSHLSPLAALTNTDYPESFGSQLLAQLPSTPDAAMTNIGTTGLAMISNPFHLFASLFGSFLLPGAHAAPDLNLEPNGVQQKGYTTAQVQDPELHLAPKDIAGPPGSDGELTGPDGLINQYDCPVITDPNQSNPCLLDTAAAQTFCAGTTTNDDGGLGGNGDPGPCGESDPAAAAAPDAPAAPSTADIQSLAQQILANKNVTFWTNNGVNTRDVFVALAAGKSAYTTCANANGAKPTVNPNILKFILEAAGKTHIMVNALTDKCHTNGSNHYSGEAVDIDVTSGPLSILRPIATKYGGTKNSETSHHHFDFPK